MARGRYRTSEKLFSSALRILPGGVNSPDRAFKAVGGTPIFFTRGRGSKLVDADGHAYIDYTMSGGALIHGHAPKGLVQALAAAAQKGTSFAAPTELETRLAHRIAMLMPSIERIRFVSSGTEAAMSAIRVARAATGRSRIIAFEGGYHGHGDPFLAQKGAGPLAPGMPSSAGVPAGGPSDTLIARYNDLVSVETAIAMHRGDVAAIVAEPVAANMGLVTPAEGFLQGLRTFCDREQIPLIFDEVFSGFRVAAGGAQQLYGVRPDLTCLGKVIGGGLAVGAYGGRAALMNLLAPTGSVYQAGTLSGNPLAMTAGLWSVENLHPRLYKRLAKLAGMLAAGLADGARAASVSLQVNALGSILTPFFSSQPVRDYQSALTADTARYARFFHAMLARSIYIPSSQFEPWVLSEAHSERDIAQTITAARHAFRECLRAG